MNKRLIWIILSLSLLCITGGELYWSGYIRDNFSLTGKTPDLDVLWLFFILMIIAVVIISIKKIFCKLPFQYIAKIIIITILFCCVFEGGYLYGKYGSVNNQKEMDYIKNEWIVGISLSELKQYINNGEENLIYFGRDDCQECIEFEKIFSKILEQHSCEAIAYYTTQDRNGADKEKLYAILDKLKISSVPSIIVVKNGEILQRFQPNDIKSLQKYYDITY